MGYIPATLPAKFLPFLMGHFSCPEGTQTIDRLFQSGQPLQEIKGNIFDGGSVVLKSKRNDGLNTTPDTHLYRVRKNEKIRAHIRRNGLEGDFATTDKFLYWNQREQKFYVVATKLPLSNEVARPQNPDIEAAFRGAAATLNNGQVRALVNNNPQKSVSVRQAQGLAEMSILGYTDLSYNNLYFTEDGRIAIIDTEPHKRALKKICANSMFFKLFGDKGSVLAQQAIAGMAKLKLYCDNPEAIAAINKVERNHALWNMGKLVAKIALVALAFYFLPTVLAMGLGGTALSIASFALKSFFAIKIIFLTLNVYSIYTVWSKSQEGLLGVAQIEGMERMGLL